MFGVTCTCSWLELFVVIWSWVKNDAAPFLGVGGLVGGYDDVTIIVISLGGYLAPRAAAFDKRIKRVVA